MPIKSISVLKAYFETGDTPTESQFVDLIDSFLHKSTGVAVTNKTYNSTTGDVSIAFSDNTSIDFNIKGNESEDIAFINGLQAALDSKVDKVNGKELSSNDFTNELKTKLEGLENYEAPTFYPISFISGLQQTLDDKALDEDVVKSVNGVNPDANGNVDVVVLEQNVKGLRVSANVDTAINIDLDTASDYHYKMTADTIFTFTNLPTGAEVKRCKIRLTGAFVPTFSQTWLQVFGDAYDGIKWNDIIVEISDTTATFEKGQLIFIQRENS